MENVSFINKCLGIYLGYSGCVECDYIFEEIGADSGLYIDFLLVGSFIEL